MPPVAHVTDERPKSSAFTVLNNADVDAKTEGTQFQEEYSLARGKNVNIVKPLQRINDEEGRTHLNSAAKEEIVETMAAPAGPQTILDPKFSRALDFKLRRLKEKEILQANLRRPTRFRSRDGMLAASNPNISGKDQTSPDKMMSQSHPRIDTLAPPDKSPSKISPKFDKSPSPGRKSRNRKTSNPSENNGEKPRFVTTVKCGQFLLPPPGVASLLGLEKLYYPVEKEHVVYSYSSKPKAVATRAKRCVNEDKLPKVEQNNINHQRPQAGNVFSGVRALMAGVVGMRHLVEHNDAKTKYVSICNTTLNYI